jgi:thiol:disulfide interchange protein DsbD
MKKIFLALFIMLVALQSQSQKLAPVKWAYQAVKTGEKQYNIIITANVDAPWHIYSQFVKKGPVPTTVQFAKNPLVLITGTTKEVGN